MRNSDGLDAMTHAMDMVPMSIQDKLYKKIDEELTKMYSAKLVGALNPSELKVVFDDKNVKEEQKMNNKKVVEMWYEKTVKILMDKRDKKVISLTNDDPMHKELMEQMEEVEKRITKQFGEVEAHKGFMRDVINEYYIRDFCTEASDVEIRQANDEFEELVGNLRSRMIEIKIMLEPCQTYEQEMKILEAYGIVKTAEYPKLDI